MRKIILHVVMLGVILLLLSCEEETYVSKRETVSEKVFFESSELPEGAINAVEFLRNENQLNQKSSQSSRAPIPGKFYKRHFVLFPYDWTFADRNRFLQEKIIELGRDIYVVPDDCMYVDTWFIESEKPRPGQDDRDKNLIVASDSDDDIEIDDNGPRGVNGEEGETVIYTSCEQIPLPPMTIDIIIIDNDGDGDNDGDPTRPIE